MMTDVNRLVLSDIMYQYGTTEAEVLNANNEYYALSNTAGTTINLGTLSSYVNLSALSMTPILPMITMKSLSFITLTMQTLAVRQQR